MSDQEQRPDPEVERRVVEEWLNRIAGKDSIYGEEMDKLIEFIARAKAKGHIFVRDFSGEGQRYLMCDPKKHEVVAALTAKYGHALETIWDITPAKPATPKGKTP